MYSRVLVVALSAAAVLVFIASFAGLGTNTVVTKSSTITATNTASLHDLTTSLGNCTVSFSPLQNHSSTKPIWIPNYPNAAGPPSQSSFNDVVRGIIGGLSGYPTGAKSFHTTSGSLKRCRSSNSNDVVVSCGCLHPIVRLSPSPERQKADFSSNIIVPIRNPRTNIPAYHNDKAIKYHNQVGQVSENDWRSFRDQYLEKAMDEWISFLREWKGTTYEISMYLDYDLVLDPKTGVAIVERVAKALQQSHFQTAESDAMGCIWHQAVTPILRQEAEFQSYTPGYTLDQKQYMITTLESFMEEVDNDKALVQLLQEYTNDIRVNTVLDRPFNESRG